jgi:hypothetical protein
MADINIGLKSNCPGILDNSIFGSTVAFFATVKARD